MINGDGDRYFLLKYVNLGFKNRCYTEHQFTIITIREFIEICLENYSSATFFSPELNVANYTNLLLFDEDW